MFRAWASPIALALALAVAAVAQTQTGQIAGTVRDPTGAVIAGAKITLKSTNTGATRESTTNAEGIYAVPSLRSDTYEVTVEAPGFTKFVQQVQVAVGSTNDVSPTLAVGTAATSVEVSEATELVQVNTVTQTLSQVVTSQQLNDLPTSPTRDAYALVATSGNVAEDTVGGRGTGFSINGMRSASTSVLLDGAENVDAFTAGVGQTVPLDSIQEFSVLTNNFSAEFGRASGGVVNVATKSGSNVFHGSAYEYNRVSAASSNTFYNNANDIAKGIFTRNNFGFSVGGPVKKNKLFFFANTEWVRVRSASPESFAIIDPGSYSLMAASSQAFFKQYGGFSPGLQTINKLPCAGSAVLTCDIVNLSVPTDAGGGLPQNTWMQVARVDYYLSDKTSMSGRYAGYNENDFSGTVNSSPYAGYSTGQTSFDQNIIYTANHIFSPALDDTLKVVYNRLNGPVQPLGAAPVGPTLYTDSGTGTVAGQPLVYPGYSEESPGGSLPFGGPQNLYQVYNDLAWNKGRHEFKFGGQFIQIRDNRTFGAYENAVEQLGTNQSTGLANLVAGNIYEFEGAVYPQGEYPCPKNLQGVVQVSAACTLKLPVGEPSFERNYRYNDMALYGQDSWRVSRQFTVNLGLRWEYYGVQHNANPALDSNFVLGSGNDAFDQFRSGTVQLAQNGGVFWKPDYKNFAPRVGFAWDVFGNGSTSVRGGYSIGYERNFGNVTFNAIQNPPNYAVLSLISNIDLPYTMPVYTNNAGPLQGTGSKALPAVSQRAINQNMATAYAETWDLAIDRKISRNSLFSAAYSGSHGVHLYDISNVNLPGMGSDYLGDANGANRLNLQYGSMNYRSDNGFSFYDALNLKYAATNLWGKGLSATVNYTWAHSMDNLSSTFTDAYGTSGYYTLGYLDAFNPRLNFGNSDFDTRHRLVLSGIWEVPWLRTASNKFVRGVIGGWGIGSILNIRTGLPFSIYDCNNFNGQDCPLYVPNTTLPRTGNPVTSADGPDIFNYITLPNAKGTISNQGDSLGLPNCKGLYHTGCTYTTDGRAYPDRNQFTAPGFWKLDMNLQKNFALSEKFKLQIRAELYNVLNHTNQYINFLNLDVSSMISPYVQTDKGGIYGYPGQASDERRNAQFALRMTF
jgi:outer membrane receptor protein involved in Fe transport